MGCELVILDQPGQHGGGVQSHEGRRQGTEFIEKERWSMEKEDCSMADNRGCSLGAAGLAFVTGGLLGAAAALLLAPQSGRESQKQLRGYARRAEEGVHELADKASEVVDQAMDKGREFIKDKQAILTEAVETGRTAMHRERERLAGDKT